MLTGSSSSIYSDYLDPLPTTLDAKNSPLALLAQTCYNISKDDSTKCLIPPIEKKKDGRDSSKSTSPLGDKPYRMESRSPKEQATPPPGRLSESNTSKHSPNGKINLQKNDTRLRESPREKTSPSYKMISGSGQELRSNTSRISSAYGNLSVETSHKDSHGASAQRSASLSPAAADGPPSGVNRLPPSSKIPPGLYNHTGLLSPYYPSLGLHMYPGLSSNPAMAASLLGAAAAAEQRAESSSSHHTVTHATVKTISGATTLVPVCSDPVCVQCRLAVQTAQFAPSCPTGCADCPREGHRGATAPLAGLPHHPAFSGLSPLSGLYPSLYGSPHTDALRSGQHSPPSTNQHVCSWVAGGKYCGERFSTSEELMTHLRSHTSSLDPPPSSLSSAALPSAYSSLVHPSLAHLYGMHAATPLSSLGASTSPIRSGGGPYGRSLSPNSLLSSSRFHPYLKSPLSHIPTSLPTGFPAAPGSLGSFPSLYSLPGSRLGPLVP